MTPARRYFYLGGYALHTGIYVDLLRRLADRGLTVGLISRTNVSPNPMSWWRAWQGRDRLGPNAIADVRRALPGIVARVPVWNLFPGLSAGLLARVLGHSDRGPVVLHARQIAMARLALALRRRWPEVRVIAEMEGDDLAEIAYKRRRVPHPTPVQEARWAFERWFFATHVRTIVRESDAVICVSENLRDVLVRRHGVPSDRARRFVVIPTLASREEFRFDAARRQATRRGLGLEDRYVVIYSGNLRGAWQVPDKLVETFAAIRSHRADAFFLVLTPDVDRAQIEPLLRRAGLADDCWRVRSAPHADVLNHLCAADTGLLLRERDPVNEVAAPGKFGEYVLSGLPIVMTEGIGDFSRQVAGQALACVLPTLDDRDDVARRVGAFCSRPASDQEREAFSRWAAERFAVEATLPRLEQLYGTV